MLTPILAFLFFLFPKGRLYLSERLGIWPLRVLEDAIVLHGASLGEVQGLMPLAKKLRDIYKGCSIIITTTSPTGRACGEKNSFRTFLLPFDWEPLLINALSSLNIKLFVISETEIWPGLIYTLQKLNITWIIINGRISDKSWDFYKAFAALLRPLLKNADKILVADEVSVGRFSDLCLKNDSIKLVGNTKYDFVSLVTSDSEAQKIKKNYFNADLPVLTLGSLRPGEEKFWLSAIVEILSKSKNSLRVVLAPRHPEKFEYFAEILRNENLEFTRRTTQKSASAEPILLLDTLGELSKVYAFSNFSFIGGSIEAYGGHNPLEAMIYGCPIAMGSSVYTVQDIVSKLKEMDGIITIDSVEDCNRVISILVDQPEKLSYLKECSLKVTKHFQGATAAVLAEIEELIGGT